MKQNEISRVTLNRRYGPFGDWKLIEKKLGFQGSAYYLRSFCQLVKKISFFTDAIFVWIVDPFRNPENWGGGGMLSLFG